MFIKRHLVHSTLYITATAVIALIPVQSAESQGLASLDSTVRDSWSSIITIGSAQEDRARTRQILGASLDGFQFRSPSSLSAPLAGASDRPRVAWILPRLRATNNSELPYSLNDDALWAGRGTSVDLSGGVLLHYGRLRVVVMPEWAYSQNRPYALADTAISRPVPLSRNPFSSPWHANSQSIDLPIRFGDAALSRFGGGQSSVTYNAGRVSLGAATENEWWGPGIRNALLLSNNAAGFPHLFVRTSHPISSPLGDIESRWIAGGLTESGFFDYDPTNDLRSITLLGVSLRPRGTTHVVVGAARAVFAATGSWGSALTSFPQVFRDVGQPDAVPPTDSTHPRGADQLMSLFARWELPESGVELYTEWARAQLPTSVRDFLVQPTHSQGYTLGMQWLASQLAATGGRFRLQAEATYVEQSTTFRFRDIGSWYTSHTVEQGYTQRGQPLGASIGPGASSQWLALDHIAPKWELGAYLTRVRWLQDVRSQKNYTGDSAYCGQDVSLLPGGRVRVQTPFGVVGADYSSGWRLNVFFEQKGECFVVPGRDQRNHSLSLTFTPTRIPGW